MEQIQKTDIIDVPSTINSFNSINITKITGIIDNEMNKLKQKVYERYDIPLDELDDLYSIDITSIAIKLGIKKRNRRTLEKCNQCMGRKGDGNQCTRSRRPSSEYCLSHQKSIPHGRIDDTTYCKKEKGKPGRRPKNEKYVNNPDYLSVVIQNIEGQSYLVDLQNNVYTYDFERPCKIGTYNNNQLILDNTQ